jgi:hypothetical protein
LPKFPGKSFFSKNFDPDYLIKRKNKLEAYLNELLSMIDINKERDLL